MGFCVLHKAHAPVQGKGGFILRSRRQLQLDVSGVPSAFDTGLGQSPADPESPVRPVHADSELRTVPGLFFPGDAADAGRAYDRSIQLRKDLDLVRALCFPR